MKYIHVPTLELEAWNRYYKFLFKHEGFMVIFIIHVKLQEATIMEFKISLLFFLAVVNYIYSVLYQKFSACNFIFTQFVTKRWNVEINNSENKHVSVYRCLSSNPPPTYSPSLELICRIFQKLLYYTCISS